MIAGSNSIFVLLGAKQMMSAILHSTSIPLALFDAVDAGRLQRGDLVLMVGFGAGMTAASSIIRWNGKGLQ